MMQIYHRFLSSGWLAISIAGMMMVCGVVIIVCSVLIYSPPDSKIIHHEVTLYGNDGKIIKTYDAVGDMEIFYNITKFHTTVSGPSITINGGTVVIDDTLTP